MRRALAAGVLCFNVESVAEIELLAEVAAAAGRTARVSLRVNPDVDAEDPSLHLDRPARQQVRHRPRRGARRIRARREPARRSRWSASTATSARRSPRSSPYLDALDRLLDLVEAVEGDGLSLAHIDVGGGLGITYADETPPPADALVARLLERIDARGHGHRKILLEPGRSLVGNAGVLVSEVLSLKRGSEKNFCIVDAAMNDLMRPAMYGAWMAIVECEPRGMPALACDVVGPVCESGDWLGRDRSLAVAPGDFVAVLSAGAYAMSMASNYNTRPRAAEVMVAGTDAWLIRERETVADLLRGERLLAKELPAAA